MDVITLLSTYFAVINLIGFALMGIDKYRAKKRAFRIPEATLFIVAIIGGSIGSIAGMYIFRHKSWLWYFVWGLPAFLALQLLSVYLLTHSSLTFQIM